MATTGAGGLNALPLFLLLSVSCFSTALAQQQTNTSSKEKTTVVSSSAEALADRIPLVIAHRGASGYLPEHTTEAAAYAHALHSDFIEQDVVQTKDGHLVVLHDVTLNAITDVASQYPERGRDGRHYVYDLTLSEVRTLRVQERHRLKSSKRFPPALGRFRISTLEEHIQLIQGMNRSTGVDTGLYIEIKKPADHRKQGLDPAKELLRLLQQYGYSTREDNIWIQCFDAVEVRRLRTELDCQLPLVQLFGSAPTDEQLMEAGKVVDAVGIPVSAVLTGVREEVPQLTDVIARAHESALVVHVWTHRDDQLPRGVKSSEQLLDWLVVRSGASGIFTDHPDVVLKYRRSIQHAGRIRGPFHLLQGKSRTESEKDR